MNFVERSTWQLMRSLMVDLDPMRRGWCIDAGAGVQDFYFEWFADKDYKTVLIEPLPVQQVLESCVSRKVRLFMMALAASSGRAMLAVHDDPNRHTLRGDLWPDDYCQIEEVQTITLADIMEALGGGHITALKLDIEGGEAAVLQTITPEQKPDVIAFEFGGQVKMRDGTGAWSVNARRDIYAALDHLADLGYKNGLVIVTGGGEDLRPLDFNGSIFQSEDAWGNIVVTSADIEPERLLRMARDEVSHVSV